MILSDYVKMKILSIQLRKTNQEKASSDFVYCQQLPIEDQNHNKKYCVW